MIAESLPRDEQKARALTRIAILTALIISVVAGSMGILRGAWAAVIMNYCGALAYLGLYLLHQHGRTLAARIAFLGAAHVQLTMIVIAFGLVPGAWVHYLLLMIVPFAIFSRRQKSLILPAALAAAALLIGTYAAFEVFALKPLLPWTATPAVTQTRVLVNLVLASVGAILLMRYMRNVHFQAEDGLEREHRRSEELLLNVLPASIAGRLKQGEQPIADHLDEVTVLFADIVGFTALAGRTAPAQLVEMLNDIFTGFDELADRFGLEKIKTIGDCYMAVAGLPEPRENHALTAVQMAFAMQCLLEHGRAAGRHDLRIRIGLHSGPVVAGVIGRRKFSYDLWGDAVNTASRMESHGVPGEIAVSQRTRDLVQHEFASVAREPIAVKGKGEMITYFLRDRGREHATIPPRE